MLDPKQAGCDEVSDVLGRVGEEGGARVCWFWLVYAFEEIQ